MNFYQFNNHTDISPSYRWNFLVEIDSNIMYWSFYHKEKRRWLHDIIDRRDKTIFIGSL